MARQGLELVLSFVLLLVCRNVQGIKLKFKYEECMTYTFKQYEYFYGSFVALPDVYGSPAHYDLIVTTPSASRLYERLGETEANFHLVPTEAGPHKFCLKLNQEKTISRYIIPREVLWNMVVGGGEPHDKIEESDTQYLWHHVYQIDGQLSELKSTLHYLYWRERRHRMTVESTHRRVFFYALLRAFALVSVSVFQAWAVRRMFQK